MRCFETDIEPLVGDKVTWAGAPAEVIEVGGQFHYKEDGTPDEERGVADELLIRFENGVLEELAAVHGIERVNVTFGMAI